MKPGTLKANIRRQNEQRHWQKKAKEFSKRIQGSQYFKQPQTVMLIKMKKKCKTLKTEAIQSADEEEEDDQIPEGFHLQVESLHCLNMKRAENFQAYLWQIVLEFESVLQAGGTDMQDAYVKIVDSFYWACRANKNTIIKGADCEQVLQSVQYPKCKAWKLKLQGRKSVNPMTLVADAT